MSSCWARSQKTCVRNACLICLRYLRNSHRRVYISLVFRQGSSSSLPFWSVFEWQGFGSRGDNRSCSRSCRNYHRSSEHACSVRMKNTKDEKRTREHASPSPRCQSISCTKYIFSPRIVYRNINYKRKYLKKKRRLDQNVSTTSISHSEF